jgi:hypothetical protein
MACVSGVAHTRSACCLAGGSLPPPWPLSLLDPFAFGRPCASGFSRASEPERLAGTPQQQKGAVAAPPKQIITEAEKHRLFLGDSLAKKLEKVTAEMQANPGCTGLVVRVAEITTVQDFGVGGEHSTEKGCEPHLLVTRRHSWRWGVPVLPLQGVGHLLLAGPSFGGLAAIFDWSDLLSFGIAPKDVPSFLSTASGAEYMESSMSLVSLAPDSVLFIPPGKLVTYLTVCHPDVETPDFSWAVGVPLVKTSNLHGLSDAVRTSLKKFNAEHSQVAEPRRMWAAVSQALEMLVP